MLIQPLLEVLYENPAMALMTHQQALVFPWISLDEVMVDMECVKVGTKEFMMTIDLASEKGYVQIEWRNPFSISKIRLLTPGYLKALHATTAGIGL